MLIAKLLPIQSIFLSIWNTKMIRLISLPLPRCISQLFEIRKQKQNTSILENLIG